MDCRTDADDECSGGVQGWQSNTACDSPGAIIMLSTRMVRTRWPAGSSPQERMTFRREDANSCRRDARDVKEV